MKTKKAASSKLVSVKWCEFRMWWLIKGLWSQWELTYITKQSISNLKKSISLLLAVRVVSACFNSLRGINPFAPEPPITACADPCPLYPL